MGVGKTTIGQLVDEMAERYPDNDASEEFVLEKLISPAYAYSIGRLK